MQHTLVFKLDDATPEKFQLWKGLVGLTDKICAEHGLIYSSRDFCACSYTVTVKSNAPDAEAIFKCTNECNKLEHLHGVSSTCISATQTKSPDMTSFRLKTQLGKSQRYDHYFLTWLRIAKTIDARAKELSVYIHRVPDPENFIMHSKVSYFSHFNWAYLNYFAGNACGKAGLELMHYESFNDLQTEDILDQITNVTGKHKQLSFLPKLKQA